MNLDNTTSNPLPPQFEFTGSLFGRLEEEHSDLEEASNNNYHVNKDDGIHSGLEIGPSMVSSLRIPIRKSMVLLQGIPVSSGLPFPFKLHAILDNAPTEGYDSIVSWDRECENGFKVHDREAFVNHIIPIFFKHSKYRSFQRMLNMWGFERIREGPSKGVYTHEHFQRGNQALCNLMTCQKTKRRHTAPSSFCLKQSASKVETASGGDNMMYDDEKRHAATDTLLRQKSHSTYAPIDRKKVPDAQSSSPTSRTETRTAFHIEEESSSSSMFEGRQFHPIFKMADR